MLVLQIVLDYFHTTAELNSVDRGHGPQSLKYLLSGPLQKSWLTSGQYNQALSKTASSFCSSEILE